MNQRKKEQVELHGAKARRQKDQVDNTQTGFTIVELIVTIIVAALFLAMFYQLYTILAQINSNARRDAQASDLAFSNLRRYTTASSTGLSCPGASPLTPLSTTGVDSNYSSLGSVTETTTVSCANTTDTVLVVSEVIYNSGQSKASYATYVN